MGKGSKARTAEDSKQYRENHSKIDWGDKKKKRSWYR